MSLGQGWSRYCALQIGRRVEPQTAGACLDLSRFLVCWCHCGCDPSRNTKPCPTAPCIGQDGLRFPCFLFSNVCTRLSVMVMAVGASCTLVGCEVYTQRRPGSFAGSSVWPLRTQALRWDMQHCGHCGPKRSALLQVKQRRYSVCVGTSLEQRIATQGSTNEDAYGERRVRRNQALTAC